MLQPGQHIEDRFIVEELVGRGGLAEVYRVRHLQLGSVHALKLLLFRKKRLADRLLLEGRIQAQLRHPNVVAVTDVVRHDGQYGLLMEYVDNITLEELIDSRGPIPLREALECIAPVLAGVHAAHQAGVLHRDLKPANVLLARVNGGLVPKVSDFGIAKVLDEGLDSSTRENVAMGTPGYMAPEQVLDARSVDVRTDVFALAGMLYELLAGRRAFEGEDGLVTLRSTLEGRIVPVDELVDGVPPHVSAAITKGLARDREERQPDVARLAADLLAEHPGLLAMVMGAGQAAPITLDPSRASRFSLPGTSGGGEPAVVEDVEPAAPVGGGPTLMPNPKPSSPTYDGGSVAPDGAPADEPARRRGPPLFWTGVLLAVGLLLLGTTVGVLVAGPALGWFVSPDGVAARQPSTSTDPVDASTGTVRIRSGGAGESAAAGAVDTDVATDAVAGQASDSPELDGSASGGGGSTAAAGAAQSPIGTEGTDPSGVSAGTEAGGGEATDRRGEAVEAVGTDTDAGAVADERDAVAGSASDSAQGGGTASGTADAQGTGSSTPATEPEVPPEPERAMVMPMDLFLASSWDGKVFRQPFTLRVLQERGGDVVAEGRIVLGAQQRILRLTGRYDPWTGAIALKETNGSLVMQGNVSGAKLTGTYQRQGKGKPQALELMRR